MEKLKDLPPCKLSQSLYEEQKCMIEVVARNWENSVECELKQGSYAPDVTGYIPERTYLANNSKWAEEPFGAVNDMEHSACLVFVAKHLLDYYDVESDILELKDLIVQKGYRAWRFENSDRVFFTPEVSMCEALLALPEDVDKSQISTLEDAEKYLGKPWGIGGMRILLDNIIAEYAACGRVRDTRLLFVSEVYKELQEGRMVPMRVRNDIYGTDPENKEGHFVILVAIKDQIATVVDSSVGERRLPIRQLLQATTIAWKLRPRQKPFSHYLRAPSNY